MTPKREDASASVPCQPPALGRAGKPTFRFQTLVGVLCPRDASQNFLTCFLDLNLALILLFLSCFSLNLILICFSDLLNFHCFCSAWSSSFCLTFLVICFLLYLTMMTNLTVLAL